MNIMVQENPFSTLIVMAQIQLSIWKKLTITAPQVKNYF